MSQITGTLKDLFLNTPTVALAALGGWLFSLVDAPLPWFFGSLFFVAGVNLVGKWHIRGPRGVRQTGQIFIGTTIGLYFTPVVAAIVLAHLPWMVLVAIISILLGGFGALVLRRIARVDSATAFFGNVPGGMAEMLAQGDRFGAQPVPLTISQLTRVTIVILAIPPALTFFGETGDDIFVPLAAKVDYGLLIVLLVCCTASSLALYRARLPNCWMLGACTFASLLTVMEFTLSAMPRELLNAAQVFIGIALGERFERSAMTTAPKVILGSAITTIIMMAVALILAVVIARETAIPPTAMIAATAPGGLAEMSLTAAVLNLGVPLVTAYHIIRIIMITMLTLPAYRLITEVFLTRRDIPK
ncbi:MAG: AbrB family transcriptional regulator [Pseudomonadota bacterium]|nr:AbrB family transcriptional regulator [Pseudomonadota bacterium]